MKNMIAVEFMKLKRCKIIYICILGFLLASLVVLATYYGWNDNTAEWLVNQTLWFNLFFICPVIFSLVGSYIVNREYKDDTIKSLLIVPIDKNKLMISKLWVTVFIIIILSAVSFSFTIISSILVGARGLTIIFFIASLFKYLLMGIACFISILPILALVILINKGYWFSLIISMIYGFVGIFAANTSLADIYPLTATLGIINYGFADEIIQYDYLSCYTSIIITLIVSLVIIKRFSKYTK